MEPNNTRPARERSAAGARVSMRALRFVAWVVALAGLTSCSAGSASHSPAAIRARGELVILTRNAPTSYYEEHDEPTG
ncbi:MAG TPA: hypothetical protein ENI71_01895, partial [Chromatiales bacterium]|nr:hypothetical protein [Chromatiales bacterium]